MPLKHSVEVPQLLACFAAFCAVSEGSAPIEAPAALCKLAEDGSFDRARKSDCWCGAVKACGDCFGYKIAYQVLSTHDHPE